MNMKRVVEGQKCVLGCHQKLRKKKKDKYVPAENLKYKKQITESRQETNHTTIPSKLT